MQTYVLHHPILLSCDISLSFIFRLSIPHVSLSSYFSPSHALPSVVKPAPLLYLSFFSLFLYHSFTFFFFFSFYFLSDILRNDRFSPLIWTSANKVKYFLVGELERTICRLSSSHIEIWNLFYNGDFLSLSINRSNIIEQV